VLWCIQLFLAASKWEMPVASLKRPSFKLYSTVATEPSPISGRRVEHSPHGWAYHHPVQDPKLKKLEVEAGFLSRSSVFGEKGNDPDTVDEERQEDDKREQRLLIGPYSQAVKNAQAPAGASGDLVDADDIDNDEYSAPPNP
jgi:capsid protein